MASSKDRLNAIAAAYHDERLTLEEVAARYGVTRQRIHQLLAEAGRPSNRSRERHQAMRRRLLDEHAHRTGDLLKWFDEAGFGAAVERARAAGVPKWVAELILRERTLPHERMTRQGGSERVYTDEDIIAAMRRVAGDSEVLPYVTYYDSDERPSATTALLRFGTWAKACEAAGLRATARPMGAGMTRYWTRERITKLAPAIGAQLGPSFSRDAYDQRQKQHRGRWPSSSVIVIRFGGSWRTFQHDLRKEMQINVR